MMRGGLGAQATRGAFSVLAEESHVFYTISFCGFLFGEQLACQARLFPPKANGLVLPLEPDLPQRPVLSCLGDIASFPPNPLR